MELREAMRRRKMVRTFRPDPVPPEVLASVLGAVLHAPSAGFTQGNEFLVLSDPAAVADFLRLTDEEDLRPVVVVLPMANRSAYVGRYSQPDKIAHGLDDPDKWPAPFWDIDAGMASMLVLLAAVEHGLGALFTGIATGWPEVRERFAVPEEFRPIGAIHLGYPADADPLSEQSSARTRRRRSLDELTHHDLW